MTIRKSLFYVRLALVAAMAGLGLPAHADPAPTQPRTITVSGKGEVKAVPDQAILTAGVVSQAASAGDALAANRRAMNTIFATLKRQGIPDKSIQTFGFNISPQYETGPHARAMHIVNYQVSNNVSITIDDVSKIGFAIDALVASGANSMGGISFTVRDPKPLQRQARDAAVKDAIDKAQTYAQAAGLTLGPISQINEGGEQTPRPLSAYRIVGGAYNDVAIAAGEETISAQVTVTFEIK
jgi:uncharacterized protein YggE